MKNTTSFRFLRVSRALLACLALTGVLAPGLYAARCTDSCEVDTAADTHDADYFVTNQPFDDVCADANGKCSLRAAIETCNAGKANRITFRALTNNPKYVLTQKIPLTIKTNLTIAGRGQNATRIDGGSPPQTRILEINPGIQGTVEFPM
jgi:hypothetical protein